MICFGRQKSYQTFTDPRVYIVIWFRAMSGRSQPGKVPVTNIKSCSGFEWCTYLILISDLHWYLQLAGVYTCPDGCETHYFSLEVVNKKKRKQLWQQLDKLMIMASNNHCLRLKQWSHRVKTFYLFIFVYLNPILLL